MPKKEKKSAPKKKACVRGLSLDGKYAVVYIGDETIQVNRIPTVLILLSFFIGATIFFFIGMLFPFFWVRLLVPFTGAVLGYILATKLLPGKKQKTFKYYDISCLVLSRADFTIISTANEMFAMRGLTKKQDAVIEAVLEDIEDGNKYKLVQHGDRYAMKKLDELTKD